MHRGFIYILSSSESQMPDANIVSYLAVVSSSTELEYQHMMISINIMFSNMTILGGGGLLRQT